MFTINLSAQCNMIKFPISGIEAIHVAGKRFLRALEIVKLKAIWAAIHSNQLSEFAFSRRMPSETRRFSSSYKDNQVSSTCTDKQG